MQTKQIKVESITRNYIVSVMQTLQYTLDKEEVENKHIILTFSRDQNIEHKKELNVLEYQYTDVHIPSLVPAIFLCVISFLLLTVLLIVSLTSDSIDKTTLLLAFGLPSSLCLGGAAIYSAFRMKKINEIANTSKAKIQELEEKVKQILK